MSLANTVAEHLPFLRRYARALTGSQSKGDAAVVACLTRLVDGSLTMAADLSPRIALYQTFHAQAAQQAEADAPVGNAATAFEDTFGQLATVERQALLLTSMEGFDVRATAAILGLTDARVREAVKRAVDEIRDQNRTRVLVIEDEPIIALDLKVILEDMGHEVVATAATRDEAVRLATELRPGLVLADIRLADGSSGIDAVKQILTSFEVPIIFVTAYPERLLTGERPEPAFLVTKPFAPDTIKATVGQALLFS
jgi:CheY-like chemotaxis protein/DNA-directed RNA polymerase specialized sigma24 family protein